MKDSDISETVFMVSPLGGKALHAGSYIGAEKAWYWKRPPYKVNELLLLDGGAARIEFSDETIEVNEGDIVFLPAGERCSIKKLGLENMVLRFCQFDTPSVEPEGTSLRELMKSRAGRGWKKSGAAMGGVVLIPRLFRHPPKPGRLKLFMEMEDIEADAGPGHRIFMFWKFHELLVSIHHCVLFFVEYEAGRAYSGIRRKSGRRDRSGDTRHVQRALHYINTHLQDPLTPADVAEAVLLNRDYLGRLFKFEVGTPVGEYILRRKMDIAKARLMGGNRSVKQVAAGLGFSDSRYFARRFKEVIGEPPSAYLRHRSPPAYTSRGG